MEGWRKSEFSDKKIFYLVAFASQYDSTFGRELVIWKDVVLGRSMSLEV